MQFNEAVSAMRHHGASDETIVEAFKGLTPEHAETLEELEKLGATPAALVNTAEYLAGEAE